MESRSKSAHIVFSSSSFFCFLPLCLPPPHPPNIHQLPRCLIYGTGSSMVPLFISHGEAETNTGYFRKWGTVLLITPGVLQRSTLRKSGFNIHNLIPPH